jgi:hypothetical protein
LIYKTYQIKEFKVPIILPIGILSSDNLSPVRPPLMSLSFSRKKGTSGPKDKSDNPFVAKKRAVLYSFLKPTKDDATLGLS